MRTKGEFLELCLVFILFTVLGFFFPLFFFKHLLTLADTHGHQCRHKCRDQQPPMRTKGEFLIMCSFYSVYFFFKFKSYAFMLSSHRSF